jgi:plastocyanin
MMRGVVTAAVIMALALAVVPALATDNVTLEAYEYGFRPNPVTIRVGDTVTFTIDADAAVPHNFAFTDGPDYPENPAAQGSAWTNQTRTFTQTGTYAFVCEAHAFMTGTITVEPATATPTPDPTQPSLEVQTLRVAAPTFCTKRSRTCRKPGVRVRIDLSQAAKVAGTLARRPSRGSAKAKRFGRVRFGTVAPGMRTLSFTKTSAGKRLTAGRYTLKLTIGALTPRTLRFKVH